MVIATIGSLVGSYHLPDRQGITPAIAVVPDPELGYNYPPLGTAIDGLEVRIRVPLVGLQPLLGNQPMRSPKWEIRLLQRDYNRSAIQAASELIGKLSTDLDCQVSAPQLIPPNQEKDIPEQIVISLLEHLI